MSATEPRYCPISTLLSTFAVMPLLFPRPGGWRGPTAGFVLTARTEVTDRMLIFGQRHLQTILAQYEATTTGAAPIWPPAPPPRPDHPAADLSQERIQRRPVLGGLISEYERAA